MTACILTDTVVIHMMTTYKPTATVIIHTMTTRQPTVTVTIRMITTSKQQPYPLSVDIAETNITVDGYQKYPQ